MSRTVTLEDQIKCVEREIKFRVKCYPRFVANAKMAQATADKETRHMMAVLETLKEVRRKLEHLESVQEVFKL